MDKLKPILGELAVFLPLGGVVLVFAAARGWLRPAALQQVPLRQTRLVLWDVLVSLGILVGGALISSEVMRRIGLPMPATDAVTQPSSQQQALGALLSQGLMQLPAVLYVLMRVGKPVQGWRALGILPTRLFRHIATGGVALLLALPLILATMILTIAAGLLINKPVPVIGHELLNAFTQEQTRLTTLALLFSTLALAPLFEEIIFRGLLQSALLALPEFQARRWGVVCVAAAVFASVHVGGVAWQALPGLFVLGVVLGWLYERTGSLWPGIFVHLGFNAFNIAAVLLLQT